MSRLVPFFAPGVYHLTKEERHSTWDYKAQLCRMLGYDKISRDCYKILTILDGKILSRKDVVFDVEYLMYSLPDLIEAAEGRDGFLEFENENLEVTDDKKLVGDEIAPYFAFTREA